jgi:phosphate transport system substrate-binding protein
MQNNKSKTAILALAGALAFSSPATAQTVNLKSEDGSVDIVGVLAGVESDAYILETTMGQIRVATDQVTCFGDGCPIAHVGSADVHIGGSDTVGLGLMPLLLDGYAGAQNAATDVQPTTIPNEVIAKLTGDDGYGDELATILVSSTTSGNGFDLIEAGKIDVSMASRRIRPEEARAIRNAGGGNMVSPSQEHVIAVDSLVLITHPDNPVKSLTQAQVADIYAGRITNWSEVGGADLPILATTLPEGSGTRSVFESRIFGDSGSAISADITVVATNPDASQFIDENIGGLAYVSFAFQRGGNPLTIVNNCGIAMRPDAFSARTEEYALQRRLYAYTREDTVTEATQDFLSYVKSVDADNQITKAGFIGFAVDRRDQSLDGQRARALLAPVDDPYEAGFMRDMLAQMVDYDRLSTTFRFRSGSSNLDERAAIDKQRLITYLEAQPEGTEIVFVGFTDAIGEFDGNLSLSQRRAALVEEEFSKVAGDRLPNVRFSSVGFGEVSPSACNDTEDGRRINRRVEVWIKQPA